MAQTSDSQVAYPVITFQVNLETIDRMGHLVPNRITTDGNETSAEADDQRNHRSIYIPGLLAGENRANFHHGDQFTVKGEKATYLKKLYVSTPASSNDLLSIVSEG